MFRAIVWAVTGNFHRATATAVFTGRVFAFSLILLGVSQSLERKVFNGLWTAFIGWYLESAAASQLQQQTVKDLLVGHKVSEAMSRDCIRVSSDLTLHEVVEDHVLAGGFVALS